ncbi:MAG: hypothetical protein K0A94_09365 [Desulfuromonadales bacterium]|nr:hypothetical protein [Desulfuromonadales bacterium]
MTLLGLVALAYYAVLVASGAVSTDVMPQFVVSAVIFLSSGRLLRGMARNHVKEERKDVNGKPRPEPDWARRTQILNWVMVVLIMCALGLWIMKPVGVTFFEMFGFG